MNLKNYNHALSKALHGISRMSSLKA